LLLASRAVGVVLLIAGGSMAWWSLSLFRAARTTTIPFEAPSRLVTGGPYRFSRNPMYVSLILVYLGEAAVLAQVGPVLLLPLVIAYLHRTVIPVEEGRLREIFGDAYEE